MSMLSRTPFLSTEAAARTAEEIYGISGRFEPLPSERDQNFLIRCPGGEVRVLKVANGAERRDFLEAQNTAMSRAAAAGVPCPVPLPSSDGGMIAEMPGDDGRRHFVRLLTFLPGEPLAEVARPSAELLEDFGRGLGELTQALSEYDHAAVHREFHWDLARAQAVVKEHRQVIDDEIGEPIDHFSKLFSERTLPVLAGQRTSVIHNDANDHNVIVRRGSGAGIGGDHFAGLIDFGDMVHSWTIAELAVAIAYIMLDKRDPLAAATTVVGAYHRVFPITEDEIETLFPLAAMRLCLSACHAAHQQVQRPEDPYLSISQQPIRSLLPKLGRIPPDFARAVFRHACGLPPVKSRRGVETFLAGLAPAPVVEAEVDREHPLVLDLGIASPLVSADPRGTSATDLAGAIRKSMCEAGVEVAVGRYDEARLLYTTPQFEDAGCAPGESRSVHLGVDLFAESGTPVLAPLAGRVHDRAVIPDDLDYGGVVVLEHLTDDGTPFFSLYGHLAHASVEALEVGREIAAGEAFAALGETAENGGWAPHLHFQLFIEDLELGVHFPGVCLPSERSVWRALSPDPNLLLKIAPEAGVRAYDGYDATLEDRRRRVGGNLSLGYSRPLKIERGWMQYLFDHTGRRYLDAYNNVPHVGHCRSEVVEAAREQMALLNTNTRYLHDGLNRYAERLCATFPEPLDVCFFVNSASEGNELALRLARAATGRKDVVVLEAAYHGHTTSLIECSPYKHDGPGGSGAPDWVRVAPLPDVFRGEFRRDDQEAGRKYAERAGEVIEGMKAEGRPPGAFIAESAPSVGGQIILPDGYLERVYDAIRAAGGLCIADEVQTAYGRLGTHFYAFEAQGVVPDIVVLGKPIGNGHPISAVVTTREIAEAFDNGMEFFSTFGGNTVSTAVGLKVLEIVLDEDLQAHAKKVGDRLLEGLRPLVEEHPIVGDVRGSGLFLGIELVRDALSLEPAAEEAAFIVDRLREEGVLIGTDGPLHNVLKIRPPMPFDEGDADRLVNALAAILELEVRI